MNIQQLMEQRNAAVERMRSLGEQIESPAEDADLDALDAEHREVVAEIEKLDGEIERIRAVQRAREQHQTTEVAPAQRVEVGREEPVYRPDMRDYSFFGDLIRAKVQGDPAAAERVQRHEAQLSDEVKRDVTAAAGAAGVIPPSYMPELYAPQEAYGRPFLSQIQRFPMPMRGTSHTIPYTATSPTAAVQATENTALSETDADIDTQTYYTAAYGGIQDMSLQAYDLSDPAFDAIVTAELMARYYEATEVQAFTGAGTARLYLGLDNVSSIQTKTYTASTPTQSELRTALFDAFQKVHSNLYAPPDAVLMHPRRAAWLAAGTSSESPLFQQRGVSTETSGMQDAGVLDMGLGIPVITTPAIATTEGAGTNQDAIYVVAKRKMFFAEGPLQVEVFRSPGSATGTVRIRLFAYSLFISGRYANAICKVSGTGLVTPAFS